MAPKIDPTASNKPATAASAPNKRPATPVNPASTADEKRKASQSPKAAGTQATGPSSPPRAPITGDGKHKTSPSTKAAVTQPKGPSTPPNATTTADGKRKATQSPQPAGGSTTQASRPAKSAAPDRINNLRITAKEGNKVVPIENGKNARYELVEEIVRKALRVLESTEGNDSLANMTEALLERYIKRRKPTTWGDRPRTTSALKTEMSAFVKKLRDNFPEIKIRTAPEGDAYTERFEPIGDADVVDFAKFDMERVALLLPADIIANIMKAKEMNVPTCITHHMFHMILTVCHEVMHILVCALSGERRPVTPENMKVEGHTAGKGESGWWWEIQFLGGIVKMYEDKTDASAAALARRQSGLPLLATGNSDESTFRRIDPAYIADFVKDSLPAGFKRFPVKCTNDPTMSFDTVTETYGKPMSTARASNRVIKNPSLNNSPERRDPKAAKVQAPASTATGTRSSSRIKDAAGKAKAADATIPARPKGQ